MIGTPKPLFAEHQYSPERFLAASKLSVSPLATGLPSLIHVIVGTGLPVAVQWKVVSSDSSTVWSTGLVVKCGGTKTFKTRMKLVIRHTRYVVRCQPKNVFEFVYFEIGHVLLKGIGLVAGIKGTNINKVISEISPLLKSRFTQPKF